jgi:hypothetical protein
VVIVLGKVKFSFPDTLSLFMRFPLPSKYKYKAVPGESRKQTNGGTYTPNQTDAGMENEGFWKEKCYIRQVSLIIHQSWCGVAIPTKKFISIR